MISLIAHLRLLGRRDRSVWVGGYNWRYCLHRSHRLRLPCWRWFVYDGYCHHHNRTCYNSQ